MDDWAIRNCVGSAKITDVETLTKAMGTWIVGPGIWVGVEQPHAARRTGIARAGWEWRKRIDTAANLKTGGHWDSRTPNGGNGRARPDRVVGRHGILGDDVGISRMKRENSARRAQKASPQCATTAFRTSAT